tara:strand:+ start:128 stop:532 length:405 start_codon:yes stop_codon:yes gene_type:complete
MSTVRFQGSAKIFARRLKSFGKMSEERLHLVFLRSAREAFKSIKFGSAITGAPGQPVKTGKLINSWRMSGRAREGSITIETDVKYAPLLEDNFRGATLRSKVGGFHSVKITRMNYRLIVSSELNKVKAEVTMKR